MKWVAMDPHGFILREGEAMGIIGVSIYLIGIWSVLLDWIWLGMLVGRKCFEKTQKIGGALIPASMPDIKYEYIDLLNYYRKEIKSVFKHKKNSICFSL